MRPSSTAESSRPTALEQSSLGISGISVTGWATSSFLRNVPQESIEMSPGMSIPRFSSSRVTMLSVSASAWLMIAVGRGSDFRRPSTKARASNRPNSFLADSVTRMPISPARSSIRRRSVSA